MLSAGRLGLGNASFAGLGEGSSGCFSTCLCWLCCLLGPWPASLCQHKPRSAQELRCCHCHRPGCGHRAGVELQADSKCPLLSWVVFSRSELNPSICCRKAAAQWELHLLLWPEALEEIAARPFLFQFCCLVGMLQDLHQVGSAGVEDISLKEMLWLTRGALVPKAPSEGSALCWGDQMLAQLGTVL